MDIGHESITETVIACPACGGECQFEYLTGYDPRDGSPTGWIEPCGFCKGKGEVVVDMTPITLEDLISETENSQ